MRYYKIPLKADLLDIGRNINFWNNEYELGLAIKSQSNTAIIWSIENCLIKARHIVEKVTQIELDRFRKTAPHPHAYASWSKIVSLFEETGLIDSSKVEVLNSAFNSAVVAQETLNSIPEFITYPYSRPFLENPPSEAEYKEMVRTSQPEISEEELDRRWHSWYQDVEESRTKLREREILDRKTPDEAVSEFLAKLEQPELASTDKMLNRSSKEVYPEWQERTSDRIDSNPILSGDDNQAEQWEHSEVRVFKGETVNIGFLPITSTIFTAWLDGYIEDSSQPSWKGTIHIHKSGKLTPHECVISLAKLECEPTPGGRTKAKLRTVVTYLSEEHVSSDPDKPLQPAGVIARSIVADHKSEDVIVFEVSPVQNGIEVRSRCIKVQAIEYFRQLLEAIRKHWLEGAVTKKKRKRGPSVDTLARCKEAMRAWLDQDKSLTKASDLAHVDRKTVEKWISSVLEIVDPSTKVKWTDKLKALNKLP